MRHGAGLTITVPCVVEHVPRRLYVRWPAAGVVPEDDRAVLGARIGASFKMVEKALLLIKPSSHVQ